MRNTIRGALLCGAMTVAFAWPAQAALKVIVPLDGKNGEQVFGPPIQAADGNLYGATVFGGKNGDGVFYRMSLKGKYKILYSFCAQANCADGAYPAWVTQGADGNFYGTTYQGGAANAGTIFSLTADGKLTTLYNFCSQANCTDGALPQSSLVQTADGSFYGTTVIGGANNQGTVFKLAADGTLTTLYSFCPKAGCSDGAQPNIGLTLASDGNFYGTAALYGNTNSACGPYGCGTLYRITPQGKYTVLYAFCSQTNCSDGDIPQGLLVQGSDGDLYGTTDAGGATNAGTAFKISLKGKFTALHSFCTGNCADGAIPYAGLIQGKGGSFYGTADLGGTAGFGTVFKMTPTGTVTPLAAFDDGTDGGFVAASVLQASNGQLYGGTTEGGNQSCSSGCGTIFRLSAKANPMAPGAGQRDIAKVRASRVLPLSLLRREPQHP